MKSNLLANINLMAFNCLLHFPIYVINNIIQNDFFVYLLLSWTQSLILTTFLNLNFYHTLNQNRWTSTMSLMSNLHSFPERYSLYGSYLRILSKTFKLASYLDAYSAVAIISQISKVVVVIIVCLTYIHPVFIPS